MFLNKFLKKRVIHTLYLYPYLKSSIMHFLYFTQRENKVDISRTIG